MARPANANLNYTEGDDETYTIQIHKIPNPATPNTTTPINLTGGTPLCQIRDGYANTANQIIATATVTLTDPTNGICTINLTDAQTTLMAGRRLRYDLQITIASKTRTYLSGELIGNQEISR